MKIIKHDYNGSIISQDTEGYVSLTDMAQAVGKRVNDYSIVEMVAAIDADREWQQFRLFVGNNTNDAVEVEPDTASSRRWKVLISVG